MQKKFKISGIALLIFVLVFLAGTAHLFVLRFEAGDIYPPYSSLRADPLGVKAFYESVGNLSGMDVIRNYDDEDKISDYSRAAFFYFGVPAEAFRFLTPKDVAMVEKIATAGGRMVICLYPHTDHAPMSSEKEDESEPKEEKKAAPPSDAEKEDPREKLIEITKRWQFEFAYQEGSPSGEAAVSPVYETLQSQPSLSWHSRAYFITGDSRWVPVLEVDGRPVIIERKFGRGSLVLATDSYFVSNEALVKERHPALLAWLPGPYRKVVFDETHLGLNEEKGMMSLFKKYRLQGFLLALVVLGILFIWKNSYSLVPAGEGGSRREDDAVTSGKDSLSGFVGMLKRSIAPASLLSVCLDEWAKGGPQSLPATADKKRKIRELVKEHAGRGLKGSGLIALYKEIGKILAERKLS